MRHAIDAPEHSMADDAPAPQLTRRGTIDDIARGNPVLAAIAGRTSIRAFLPTPVARADIERILAVATRAPSGSNTQPWKVHVLIGAARDRLVAAATHAYDHERGGQHRSEYEYYMTEWRDPYLARRRRTGWSLYGLLGITREDKAGMHAQHRRNFTFFDAPVGLIFTIDRDLERGSWLDYGMFLENVVVAARGLGLETCAQAAWARYHNLIRAHLGIPESEVVMCGMAIGHPDPAAIVNRYETTREPLAGFARFHEE
ncbi:MAG: nitroreductase [Alphaproteobacteria bacterium]